MYSSSQSVINYIYNYKPIINYGALFSDGTERFRSPAEPKTGDAVTLRFRTARDNVDYVYVIYNGQRLQLEKTSHDKLFDHYEVTLPPLFEKGYYYYEIGSGNITIYYNKLGVVKEPEEQYSFTLIPDFYVPEWAKGAVFYQIYVDRFCNGDKSNDVLTNEYRYINGPVKHVDDWNKIPDAMDVGNFYGGDLQGVMDKLDYLQDLGIDAIYFNPLFVSPSNHKYDIQDYDYIDPHFGKIVSDEGNLIGEDNAESNAQAGRYIDRVTNKENLRASNRFFIKLVEEAHKRGIKVILDGVFNHCGSFNKWIDRERIYENREGYEKGAYVSKDSPYSSFFKFRDHNAWPYNGSYDGWWGHDTLPKLNYEESEKLHDYIMEIGKKWVSPPYNCDGWRLDVAADLGSSEEYNHRFWRDFRNAVRSANPNAIILAEHYGNPKPWLEGDQWDTIMNYGAFMEPITWFLTGVEKHSDEFRGDFLGNPDFFWQSMRYYMAFFNQNSLEVAMNELSNHDHSRFLTRTNRRVGRTHTLGAEAANENVNKDIFREAVVFQMTWPGAPTIYYGDEAGVCGWTDPDSRRTYPWGHEDKSLIAFHKDVIRIHKESEALMRGSLIKLHGSNKCIAFGRFTDNEAAVTILNCDYEDKRLNLHVRQLGVPNNRVMTRVLLTHEGGYDLEDNKYMVQNNTLTVIIPRMSAAIYIYKKSE